MDYKAKLQLNNNELEGNNVDLQTILDTINILPEASTGGTNTSDATAVAEDIVSGKTAYISNGKATGTLVVNYYYVGNTPPSNSFGNNGDLYFVRGE